MDRSANSIWEYFRTSIRNVHRHISQHPIWDQANNSSVRFYNKDRRLPLGLPPPVVYDLRTLETDQGEDPVLDLKVDTFILAKDTTDLHLRERHTITSTYCLQIFGNQGNFKSRFVPLDRSMY